MNQKIILTEISLKGIKSSGPGGQHVNKVSTKIELSFDLNHSSALSENEKSQLQTTIGNRLTKEGILILNCSESRSQFKNKNLIIKKFLSLLFNGLKKQKPRKATKPSKNAIKRRLDSKKSQSQKKANRRKIKFD